MSDSKVLYLIGDSMIEYGEWDRLLPGFTPVNLGRSGETAVETLWRLDGIAARSDTPDAVIFMTGTNNVTMEEFAFFQVYDDIVAKSRELWPEARIIINSLLPMNLSFLAPDAVSRVNENLAAAAKRLGVEYLDAFTPLSDGKGAAADGVLADEVHITEEGYRRWAAAIADHLST